MVKRWMAGWFMGWIPLLLGAQSVGLVLSGGGAKGLAHIGVIRALEEYRIPIDYIGGTSMGAIIGGLYAMGLSTDDMIRIVKSEEFNTWMSGKIQEPYRYYFKEEYPGPDLVSLGVDLKDTVPRTRLPLSVIPNHLMDFAFMELFSRASAAAGYDFDSLFVPFLCNSVDISHNKEVIFRKGDLAQAVRASMTVPLYFRPIVIDGNIMYDGGIYNNFPVNHVEESFHPDVLIGSKAAEGNTPPDEFDILGQIENIVMKPSDYDIDPDKGILLDMNLNNESLLDFEKVDEFVEVGYRVTLQKMDSIRLLVSRQGPDSTVLKKEREVFTGSWPELRFKDLEISGLNEEQKVYVESSIRKSDSIIGLQELKREYLKLVHDQGLLYLYPHAVYHPEDSLFTLHLRVVPQAPLEARFGLFFASSGLAQTYLGFSYRTISELSTHLKGSIQFGRFYNGVNLGFRFDYPSRIPLYFQGSFNYNSYDYNAYNTNFFFEDLKPSYITEDETNFRFDAGIPYSMNGVIKGGLGIGRNREIYYMTKDFSSEDTSEVSLVNLLSAYVAVERNSLNNKQFATEGSYRSLGLRFGYGIESYIPGSTSIEPTGETIRFFWFSGRFETRGYLPVKGAFSLGYHFQLEANFKPLLNNYFSTIIEAPAFKPNLITSGLFMEQYRAYQFVAAGLMPVYAFSDRLNVKLEAYGFFPVQDILSDAAKKAYKGPYFNTLESIYCASVNLMTVAGPLSFNVGYITGEERPWAVQLSFGYLLFNKKSTDI
ncbi:MAG: patatin-like phospholipase family protein [Bacteroidales bacterium]